MPDPEAPSPEPLLQPYLERRRSAKPCWPGRRERGASLLSSSALPAGGEGGSLARAVASSASEEGSSVGGGGRL